MVLVACGTRPQQPAAHPDWSYNSVVYEMNVRQYTPEGTLAEAARHLPRLQEMGVDVVWLMPVYPIGVKERKGTLGSYYAISDYEAVNPEFGTLEDFDRFLAEAHRLGLRVILDWVANHTSPDARWIEERPADWYVRDSLGNTIVQYDWTDIAKLDYGNADMRARYPSTSGSRRCPHCGRSTPASTCSPRAKPPHCTTGRSTPRMRGNCTTC